MDISKSILKGLSDLDQTQSWLARTMGVSRNYVNMLCLNKKAASLKTLAKIAAIFKVKVSVFISWGEE